MTRAQKTETPEPQEPREYRIADNMIIRFVDINSLHEQPINAQLMDKQKFDTLTQNIKLRGQLESLPYCYQKDDNSPIEIISGHHRVRAANAAGLTRIPVIIDSKPMTRSTITAKQIAANQLTGYTDEKTLHQLLENLTSVDDMLLTGLDDSQFAAVDSTTVNLNSLNMKYDFKTVELTFLSKEFDEFKQFIEKTTADMTVIASSSLYQQFSEEIITYANRHNIKNVNAAISRIIEYCQKDREENTEKVKK